MHIQYYLNIILKLVQINLILAIFVAVLFEKPRFLPKFFIKRIYFYCGEEIDFLYIDLLSAVFELIYPYFGRCFIVFAMHHSGNQIAHIHDQNCLCYKRYGSTKNRSENLFMYFLLRFFILPVEHNFDWLLKNIMFFQPPKLFINLVMQIIFFGFATIF